MRQRISQREARQLRRRVADLENRLASFNRWWSSEYAAGGQLIDTLEVKNVEWHIVRTANRCDRTVVARASTELNKVCLYAVKV